MSHVDRFAPGLGLLLLGLGAGGCGQYYEIGRPNAHRGFAILTTPGLLVAQAPPNPDPVYVTNVVYVNGSEPRPAPAPPRRPPVDDRLPPFDPVAARLSANAVADVSECDGAPAYGHARLTMDPDGRVSKVVIDEPSGLSQPVIDCVGDHLGAATMTPFRGSLVTFGTTFFAGRPGGD